MRTKKHVYDRVALAQMLRDAENGLFGLDEKKTPRSMRTQSVSIRNRLRHRISVMFFRSVLTLAMSNT